MKRAVVLIGLVVGLAGACTTSPPGPGGGEMSALLVEAGPSAPVIRNLDCTFIVEEGSEWVCRYQQRTGEGRWLWRQAVVARDGGRWILIDGVVL